MSQGLIFVISGPAGSGKGTVVNEILKRDPRFMCAVSATTRPRLKGEVDGVNYHYITREEFEAKIESGEVLEHTEYCGNYYGTLVSEFDRARSLGRHLILEIEVDGASQIKNKYPPAILVMIAPPDSTEQYRRLRDRGRDADDSIEKRLLRAREELLFLPVYDYLILNKSGALEQSVDDFFALVRAEELRASRHCDFVQSYFMNNTQGDK